MKKRVTTRKLNRSRNQRKALFKGLVNSLVINEQIVTTKAKAKAIMPIAEKLITKGKAGTLHAARQIQSDLQDKTVVTKIVKDLSVRFKDKKGGYLTLIPIGTRRGDNAMMVKLKLADLKTDKPADDKSDKSSKKKESKPSESKKPTTKKTKTQATPAQSPDVKKSAPQEPVKQRVRKVQNKG